MAAWPEPGISNSDLSLPSPFLFSLCPFSSAAPFIFSFLFEKGIFESLKKRTWVEPSLVLKIFLSTRNNTSIFLKKKAFSTFSPPYALRIFYRFFGANSASLDYTPAYFYVLRRQEQRQSKKACTLLLSPPPPQVFISAPSSFSVEGGLKRTHRKRGKGRGGGERQKFLEVGVKWGGGRGKSSLLSSSPPPPIP